MFQRSCQFIIERHHEVVHEVLFASEEASDMTSRNCMIHDPDNAGSTFSECIQGFISISMAKELS